VCVNTPQGFALNEAIRKVAAWVTTGDLCHNSHAILGWMADNAVVLTGRYGDFRLDKQKAKDKIDGIVALTMAASRTWEAPPDPNYCPVTVWGGD
jgi:phage terminase large subunit-like protein